MAKTLKLVKFIFLALVSLILVLIVALWIYFYSWKKDAINNLPNNSLVIKTEKGEVEYTLTGNSDKYMLLVHGTPGSVHVEEGNSFVENGFNVLSISRPGYYKTPLSSGETPKEQAALYKALLDELKIDSIYVNGISGGGPSSIQFALDYPERTAGLILRAAVSEKYIEAGIYLTSNNKEKSKIIYKDIILSKNKLYSILALNSIVENNLEPNSSEVLKLFDIIEKIRITKNQKNLVKLKNLWPKKIQQNQNSSRKTKKVMNVQSVWRFCQ